VRISEQIARDILEGTFPEKSGKTLREEAIAKIIIERLDVAAPGISDPIKHAIARSSAMRIAELKMEEIVVAAVTRT